MDSSRRYAPAGSQNRRNSPTSSAMDGTNISQVVDSVETFAMDATDIPIKDDGPLAELFSEREIPIVTSANEARSSTDTSPNLIGDSASADHASNSL